MRLLIICREDTLFLLEKSCGCKISEVSADSMNVNYSLQIVFKLKPTR